MVLLDLLALASIVQGNGVSVFDLCPVLYHMNDYCANHATTPKHHIVYIYIYIYTQISYGENQNDIFLFHMKVLTFHRFTPLSLQFLVKMPVFGRP